MICFRNDIDDSKFNFPKPLPLTKNMSWVFNGATLNKEIGYTLRVGGKCSPIPDRRNLDGYIVDGKERPIGPKGGKRMQGFSDEFEFPVSNSAAMKQLGDSVAIPAIQAVGEKMIKTIEKEN